MHFIVTAQYLKPIEGKDSKKNLIEKYLVNAMSVTEAEAKVIKWLPDNYENLFCKGSVFFDLDSILTVGDSEQYFLSRVKFSETSEKGVEKWFSFQVMVNGDKLSDALKSLEDNYSKGALGYVMSAIAESKIIVDEELCGDTEKV